MIARVPCHSVAGIRVAEHHRTMSEYQFVHFIAIDRPLSDEQLEFMRRQSTRATVSRREFTNEYHFGDFHGNAAEMMRRGFDLHLHYANYGTRRLLIRLPSGLPCSKQLFRHFANERTLEWLPDKTGCGGVLSFDPEGDAGTWNDQYFDVAELLTRITPVRSMLIAGDLRPLYLTWLVCNGDPKTKEPPVPSGMNELPTALVALAEFYDLGDDLLRAAAEQSGSLEEEGSQSRPMEVWIKERSLSELRQLTAGLLSDESDSVHSETLALIRDAAGTCEWPVATPTRTLEQIRHRAEAIAAIRLQKEARAQDRARERKLQTIRKDPEPTIQEIFRLVAERSVRSYQTAADMLSELREALGSEGGMERAEAIAQDLRSKFSRANGLATALRKQGFLAGKK